MAKAKCIFLFYLNKKDDSLIGRVPDGHVYAEEELESSSDYDKAVKGNPCNKESTQMANGIGCFYYAIRDICPFTGKKGYFECLP